jgi:serine/threonine protein kinase
MADFRIGKHQILATLGQGAHSTIYHIRRSEDARQYALKVVSLNGAEHQKFLDQAKHEFRVAQMLDHPNLLKVFAFETESDWMFRTRKAILLLEYVNGKTLDAIPSLTLPQKVQVLLGVSAGLVQMHKKGVCHGDMKPNNILVSRTGDVKVIDYGLAWIKGEAKGRIQGTPEYIAPETFDKGQVNERSDIYNFGATMYRVVSGQLPPSVFAEGSNLPIDSGSFERMLRPVHEVNPKVPRPMCELIHRCLSFDAMKRPERMSMVQGVLDRLADAMVKSPTDKLEMAEW